MLPLGTQATNHSKEMLACNRIISIDFTPLAQVRMKGDDMGKVKLSPRANRPAPESLEPFSRNTQRNTQRGVSLGKPRPPNHSSKGAGVLSRKAIIGLIAGTLCISALLFVFVVSPSDGSCENRVSLSRYVKDGVIKAPVVLHLDVSPRHCIQRVSFLLDGVNVGTRESFPFSISLDSSLLASANLAHKNTYKLVVVVVDERGKTTEQSDEMWVAFDSIDSPTKDANISPPSSVNGERLASLENRTLQLLSSITRRNDYVVDAKILQRVDGKVQDYKRAYEAAFPQISSDWRQEINVAFNYFSPPVVAYCLALSRSSFEPQKDRGLWQIPEETLKRGGFTEVDFASDKTSMRVAADYTRELLNAFDNDYILMVAYYGLSIDRAGLVNAEVEKMGLTDSERADIAKLYELGVLKDEQWDNVVDFLAAGVVLSFPNEFGVNAPSVRELVK